MPLRVLRLLPTIPEPTLASSLSFVSTLQLAAGQAWTRRVAASSPIRPVRKRGVRIAVHCRTLPEPNDQESTPQAGPSRYGYVAHPSFHL